MTEIFVEKSIQVRTQSIKFQARNIRFLHVTQLRDIWATEVAKQGEGAVRIDALSWLSKTTLDVIGLAGAYTSLGKHCRTRLISFRIQLQVQRFVKSAKRTQRGLRHHVQGWGEIHHHPLHSGIFPAPPFSGKWLYAYRH